MRILRLACCHYAPGPQRNSRDRLLDRQGAGDIRYATRVLPHSVGISLTFARVTGIERNTREEA